MKAGENIIAMLQFSLLKEVELCMRVQCKYSFQLTWARHPCQCQAEASQSDCRAKTSVWLQSLQVLWCPFQMVPCLTRACSPAGGDALTQGELTGNRSLRVGRVQGGQERWTRGRTTKRNLGGLVMLNLDWRANDPHMVLLKSKQPRFKQIF